MEQHSGEIESTAKHYRNTRTCTHAHLHVHARTHPYTKLHPIWTHMLFLNWNQRAVNMHCSWEVCVSQNMCVKKTRICWRFSSHLLFNCRIRGVTCRMSIIQVFSCIILWILLYRAAIHPMIAVIRCSAKIFSLKKFWRKCSTFWEIHLFAFSQQLRREDWYQSQVCIVAETRSWLASLSTELAPSKGKKLP